MKKLFFFTLFCFALFNSCVKNESKTTYYLIRHAEKDRADKTNRNPNLNKKGLERAKKWAAYFEEINVEFDMVYSTNFKRTLQTAKPILENNSLEIVLYNPSMLYNTDFQNKTKQKTVLVVGHSNTTPAFTLLKKLI